jgi:hypothetical protein
MVDQPKPDTPITHEIPSFQPWLRVTCAAFIPVLLAFVLPRGYVYILFGITGALMIAGVVMLIKQERAGNRR